MALFCFLYMAVLLCMRVNVCVSVMLHTGGLLNVVHVFIVWFGGTGVSEVLEHQNTFPILLTKKTSGNFTPICGHNLPVAIQLQGNRS